MSRKRSSRITQSISITTTCDDLPGAAASAVRLDDRRNFLVPLTVDDLAANGLLEAHPQACWERSAETLTARKDELTGLAVASDEQIEACILYLKDGEILALRSFADDHGVRLRKLLSQLRAAGLSSVRLPKVHPNEIPREWPITLGFEASRHAPGLRGDGPGRLASGQASLARPST